MTDTHRRYLKNYLLYRTYQLRYTLIMVTISSLLVAGLGYIWYEQMRVTSKTIEVNALSSYSSSDVQQLQNAMKTYDNRRLLALVGFGVLFALLLLGYGIILTHKVAGPLYKISRQMEAIKDGALGPLDELRKGDHLHEFYENFKQLHSALRTRAEEDVQSLSKMLDTLEQMKSQVAEPGALREIDTMRADVKNLIDAKEKSLQT